MRTAEAGVKVRASRPVSPKQLSTFESHSHFLSIEVTSMVYIPQHGMSEDALHDNWNIFIWSLDVTCMGFHVGDELQITISTLHRWLTIQYDDRGLATPFLIQKVDIESEELLTYTQSPVGPPIPRDSEEPLPPGDYGIYNLDGSHVHWLQRRSFYSATFAQLHRILKRRSDWEPVILGMTKCPTSIEEEVMRRDGCCALTGSNDSLVVNWIYPPWAKLMFFPPGSMDPNFPAIRVPEDYKPWMVVGNFFALAEDVADLFRENILCIDVDDNYRIVYLTGHGCVTRPLKTHYHPPLGPNRPRDDFLREHFKYSIAIHAAGGDILEDHESSVIDAIIKRLGVNDDNLNLEDPEWNTALGQEICRWLSTPE